MYVYSIRLPDLNTQVLHLFLRIELPIRLGPPDPCSTAVHMEPFSTSVFKNLTWILATTTKICTHGRSTRIHILGFNADHVALLHVTISKHKAYSNGAV